MSNIIRKFKKKYYKALNNIQDKGKRGQWVIMYEWYEKDFLSNRSYQSLRRILPPPDRFYADPFPFYHNGEYYIFIEELIFSEDVGFISVIKINKDGTFEDPVKVIKMPYHMSYPLLFTIGNDIYMMPTNHQEKKIEIWHAKEFPYVWKKECEIMQGVEAADSTPFYYQNKWWMFSSIRQNKRSKIGDELFLFSAEDVFSQNWRPHDGNPVRKGIVDNRCAGNVFVFNNTLIRPSQDSLQRYGWSIDLMQVDKISDTEYCESLYHRIEPCWGEDIKGTHTLNYNNGLLVMDGYRVI